MKIPETTANVYYTNEENGQWQPNGVIIETGVGSGVVGSGDAGVDRPIYPVHIPQAHITGAVVGTGDAAISQIIYPVQTAAHVTGYVMAGTYYGNAGTVAAPGHAPAGYVPAQDDFADYMWMEHEDEFDKQVMQQLEEEALMEQCIEAMLEDEQRERARPHNGHAHIHTHPHGHPHPHPTTSNGTVLSLEETVSRSTLNPLAAEFVPTRRPPEDKPEAPSEPVAQPEPPKESIPEVHATHTEDTHTEVTEAQPQAEPPCVSAEPADRRDKDKKGDSTKKADTKKLPRQEPPTQSKSKPPAAKSDTRVAAVQPKKKEVKPVKSEPRLGSVPTSTAAPTAPTPAPTATSGPTLTPEELPPLRNTEPTKPTQPPQVEEPSGPKPINYAAAAKANKKKTTPPPAPTTERTPPPQPTEKPKPKTEKVAPKTEKVTAANKPVQRKNSTK